jgi:hypothetical protein
MNKTNIVLEKGRCPHCRLNLCDGEIINIWAKLLDGVTVPVQLSTTVGDYTVKSESPIHDQEKLTILCPYCGCSLHKEEEGVINQNKCELVDVKIVGDSYGKYTLEFLSDMGQQGTILKKNGIEVYHKGKDYERAFGEVHANNETDKMYTDIRG